MKKKKLVISVILALVFAGVSLSSFAEEERKGSQSEVHAVEQQEPETSRSVLEPAVDPDLADASKEAAVSDPASISDPAAISNKDSMDDPSVFIMNGFSAKVPEGWMIGEKEADRVYLYPSGSVEDAYSYVVFSVSEEDAFRDLTPEELEKQFEELQENLAQGGHEGVSIRRFTLNHMPGHRLFMSMKISDFRVEMDVLILVKDNKMATIAFYTISGIETENYRRAYENFLLSVKPAGKKK